MKMRTRLIVSVSVLLAALVSHVVIADALQPKKVPRLGILSARAPGHLDIFDAFHQTLRELGYVEGKNLTVEYRFAEGKYDRLPALMAELVSLEPDVIFTHTTPGALAAKKGTTTIPIVVGAGGDLVERGVIASYARPGGNITGLTFVSSDVDNKRLELLKETAPKVSRVAVLVNPANPVWNGYPRNMEPVARNLGIRLQRVEAHNLEDLEAAFVYMTKTNLNGLLLVTDTVFGALRNRITELAAKNHLPAVAERREFAEAGGLISYGVDITYMFRRAAVYVDKILKGAKPRDLPVERPMRAEFVINLKTARAIGIKIPPEMLQRAGKVIQ
jgi:putative tryptophan/tyrosine transport system substrate-binding protein